MSWFRRPPDGGPLSWRGLLEGGCALPDATKLRQCEQAEDGHDRRRAQRRLLDWDTEDMGERERAGQPTPSPSGVQGSLEVHGRADKRSPSGISRDISVTKAWVPEPAPGPGLGGLAMRGEPGWGQVPHASAFRAKQKWRATPGTQRLRALGRTPPRRGRNRVKP